MEFEVFDVTLAPPTSTSYVSFTNGFQRGFKQSNKQVNRIKYHKMVGGVSDSGSHPAPAGFCTIRFGMELLFVCLFACLVA
jgi:hypothetical protein